MYDIYIKRIGIEEVRHIKDVVIVLSDNKRKNLIMTGRNGSGKTSLLDAIANQLSYLSENKGFKRIQESINVFTQQLKSDENNGASENRIKEHQQQLAFHISEYKHAKSGLAIDYSMDTDGMKVHFDAGEYVLAYYKATREFVSTETKHIEKVEIDDKYRIIDTPRIEFIKYLTDLKVSEALSKNKNNQKKADKIHRWFDSFENELRTIFEDDTLHLDFDEDSFRFTIIQEGRNPFGFNELSDGFAAILDIVVDLMMRMEHSSDGVFVYDMPGIVLIDEIETHLHLELQKKVMGFLTALFPNVQFIISTHSPFTINSSENAVVYDLEKDIRIEDGLTDLPYEGVVEGYYGVDRLSLSLSEKFERYKELVGPLC